MGSTSGTRIQLFEKIESGWMGLSVAPPRVRAALAGLSRPAGHTEHVGAHKQVGPAGSFVGTKDPARVGFALELRTQAGSRRCGSCGAVGDSAPSFRGGDLSDENAVTAVAFGVGSGLSVGRGAPFVVSGHERVASFLSVGMGSAADVEPPPASDMPIRRLPAGPFSHLKYGRSRLRPCPGTSAGRIRE